MTEAIATYSPPATPDLNDDPVPMGNRARRRTIQAVCGVAGAAVIMISSELLAHYYPDEALWILRIAAAIAVASFCFLIAIRHRREWLGPVQDLEKLIDEIHLGIAPIDELNNIKGGLSSVARKMKKIMHELRQQNQSLNALHEELRQRIAGRTNALERTINALRQQATRDPLSGLFNRRMLDELLPRLVQNTIERKHKLALLMIDVDNFKDLNDTLGHAAGDELIRTLGQLIHSSIRQGDFPFRVGGDEFVILLPGCDGENARIKAERLKSLISSLTSTMKVARKPQLSIGISNLTELESPTPENLMREADEHLYAAKAAGKKRNK